RSIPAHGCPGRRTLLPSGPPPRRIERERLDLHENVRLALGRPGGGRGRGGDRRPRERTRSVLLPRFGLRSLRRHGTPRNPRHWLARALRRSYPPHAAVLRPQHRAAEVLAESALPQLAPGVIPAGRLTHASAECHRLRS